MNKKEFMAMSHGTDLMIKIDGYGGFWKYTDARISDGVFFYGGKQKGCNYIKNGQIETVIPILHPLSDLTKPIEHNGEKFVPIVELAKMMYPNHEWRLSSGGNYAIVGNGYCTFEYDNGYDCFLMNNSAQMPQLECLFKLLFWHFNLMDELEPFIDVNTLETNPYK